MIERIQLVRKIVSAEAIALMLILVALQALSYGIASSLRNTDTTNLFWVCFLAMFLALGLSSQHRNGIEAAAVMVAIGLIGVWILGARLLLPLLDLGQELLSILPQLIPSIRSHAPIVMQPPDPIDTTAIRATWLVIVEASDALGMRVQTWLFNLYGHTSVDDGLVRNLVWTLILWFSAAWMGWFAGKRNALAALMPSVVLLAIVTSYSEHRVYTIWLMVSVLLLLMGIWNYKNHTTQWERKKMDYADSIGYDVSQAVIFLTIAIGSLAFITPSVSWREIRDYLRERNQASTNEAADLLGIQQKPALREPSPTQEPSLPREHLLSGGSALSKEVVMVIRTGELAPIPDVDIPINAPSYYWRSTTYDTYVGAGWVTSSAQPQTFQPNTPLIPGLLSGYKALHLDVEISQPEGKLFWSGVLFSADIPFKASWRSRPESNLFADQATLLQADLFAAVTPGSVRAYRAESYVPQATIEQLRAASTDFPADIRRKYLQLPVTLPDRVRQLAQTLTQSEPNSYDKAKAIEAYLRTYPYDLEVSAPPEGQDVADYFLFELKRGYCDYYATAMVVLARAAGIPARFVSGYSPGSYDALQAQYVVRELNAHSWAEIYFPEIGWVEFEPTAAVPEINRTPTDVDLTRDPQRDSLANKLLLRFRLEKATDWFAPLAFVLLASILYYAWIERWRYMRMVPAIAIERIYRKLYRLGRSLAGERTKAETAYEFEQTLIHKMEIINKDSRFKKLFRDSQHEIESLTELYMNALFSDQNIRKQDARKALNIWKHLRLRLMAARIHVIASRRRSNLDASYRRLLHAGRSQ